MPLYLGSAPSLSRLVLLFFLCPGFSVLMRAEPAQLAPKATTFATRLTAEMRTLIYQAAALDPTTGEERKTYRKQRLRRQRQLEKWFIAHHRSISLADCQNETDKQNYREFRATMADYDFLRLSLTRRRRFIARIDRYLQAFREYFSPALLALLHGNAPQTPLASIPSPLEKMLIARCSTPPQLRCYYFGHGRYTVAAAVYLPSTACIYLNLNRAILEPAEFIDSFEHELWHHLLVRPQPEKLTANIWWEGFDETIAESWRAAFDAATPEKLRAQSRKVAYPIQSAFATLCIGIAPQETLAAMADDSPSLALATRLRRKADLLSAHGEKGKLCRLLAKALEQNTVLSAERQVRVEKIMQKWGWKENDGAPFSMNSYLKGGQLSPKQLHRAFICNKQGINDLIQALAVVSLQDIITVVPGKKLPLFIQVAPALQKNLRRVLHYVPSPFYQYANR